MAKSQLAACSGNRPVCLKFMGLDLEGQLLVIYLSTAGAASPSPSGRRQVDAADIPAIRMLPAWKGAGGIPDGLGIWPHQELVAPALQLLSSAAIQQFKLFPSICNPHNVSTPGFMILVSTLLYHSSILPSTTAPRKKGGFIHKLDEAAVSSLVYFVFFCHQVCTTHASTKDASWNNRRSGGMMVKVISRPTSRMVAQISHPVHPSGTLSQSGSRHPSAISST